MKRIILIFLGLFSVAYGQFSPTGSKTRFVNGISLGTKLDGYYNSADSNAIYWRADSVLRAKYRGMARTLAFIDNLIWGNITGSLNNQTDLRDTLAKRIYNQFGSNLSAQTGKMYITDTIRTDGLVYGGRLFGNSSSSVQAVQGTNSSTGRAGNFSAQTGIGVYIQNRSATNPALYVLQDSTSSIARFVNNFDLGVTIDTSGDVTISNRKSTFTGKIQLPTIAANRIYTLPDNSGVLALTSNVTDSSAALRASINTKLNIADTAAMLTNYPRKDGTRATGTWNISTTGSSGSVANALTIGTGLSGTSYNGSAAVTIANTGVLSNVAGTGITVSGATGNVTITNAGVTSIAGTANQITASASTGGVTLSIPTAFIAPGYIQATSNLIAKQNTNSATGVALYLKRDTDTGPLGYLIQGQNTAGTVNLFTVDVNGAVSGASYTGNLVNTLTFGAGLNTGSFNNSAAATVSIATGGVTNAMLANSTISGVALGGTLPSLTIGTDLSGTSYNGSSAVTINNTSTLSTVTGRGATTSTAVTFNGGLTASGLSTFISGGFDTYISPSFGNTINFNYSSNTVSTGWINYRGYLNGITQFRNLNIGDGKEGVVASFEGDTKSTTFNGSITSISALLSGVQPASVATNGTAATSILNATGGKGGNTTGTTGQIAGAGSLVSLVAGAGGDAPAGSTNGNGGNVVIQSGVAGSGLGTSGSAGTISLNIGGTTALGIAANQAVTFAGRLLVGTTTDDGSSRVQVNGTIAGVGENSYIGVDATPTRLGLVKKSGAQPFLGFATDPFTIQVSSGSSVAASNTFTTLFTMATSGAATFSSSVTANSFIKSGGTSSQALMGDGSVQTLTSGTYTPTVTATGSTTSVTTYNLNYIRVGNVVTVSGIVGAANSSASGANGLTISLPFNTSTNTGNEVGGVATNAYGGTFIAGSVSSPIIINTTSTVSFTFNQPLQASTTTFSFSFTYKL